MRSRFLAYLHELRDRRVIRLVAVYAVGAWVVVEVVSTILPILLLPDWLTRAVVILALLGFPVVVALGWTFDIRRARASPASIAAPLGLAVVIALVLAASVYVLRAPARQPEPLPAPRIDLAILPFTSLRAHEADDYLSVGIPDAIITRLAIVERLRVRPTTAILKYELPPVDPVTAAKELAVDYLLTGTLQRTTDTLMVSVQLLRAADGSTLWGERYRVSQADLLELQDSVAARVSATLQIQMTAAQRHRVYRRYTDDPVAYELYLKGRTYLVRHKELALRDAVETFEKALERDSDYALAHAGLAVASAELQLRFAKGGELEKWRRRAIVAADRALELDPDLAEAHEAWAAVHRKTEFDWDLTIQESRHAIELNPSLEAPYYYLAAALYHQGLLEAADQAVRAGLELSPTGDRVEALRAGGVTALFAGRYAEATAAFEEVKLLSDKQIADAYLAQAYYYLGEEELAETILHELAGSSSASAVARAKSSLASILAARGAPVAAAELAEQVEVSGYIDHHVAYSLGAAYAQLDRPGPALLWLRRSAETGFPCYPWFARDPLLQPLRQRPEFTTLLGELREAQQLARARYDRESTSRVERSHRREPHP